MIHVVYDGLCAFCVRTMRVLAALDRGSRLEYHDANARDEVLERFPALRTADLDAAMYAVTGDGAAHEGFYAFRRIARALPLLRPIAPILYVPGVPFVGTRVYRLIARNRRRLGCRVEPVE